MTPIALNPPRAFALSSQVYVPVSAYGNVVRDNGGDVICMCFTAELAVQIATLINVDAGF